MIHQFSLLVLILWLIALFANGAYAKNTSMLESQINKTIADEKLMGIVWSTVSEDLVTLGAAGFSNQSDNRIMLPTQKMHVGSVTKTVLALGALRLITQAKLALDSQVAILLPDIALNNPWLDTAPITVKHLLEHTAGLDNIRMWQLLSTTPTPNTPLQQAFPRSDSQLLQIRTKPGSQYSYSNMGYTLLAMVIEAVTKERYEDYLDKSFLQPLAMFDSTFAVVSQTGKYADEALAMGYLENNVAQAAVAMYLRPAGQFTTTAPDMAKLIQFIFNDGVLNGQPFIHLNLMQRLGYPDNTDAEKAGLKIGHGLALAIRDRHHVVGMCHPGTTFGFRAYICIFAQQKKAFFYSINTDNDSADYEKFNAIFIKHLSIQKAPITQASNNLMDLSLLEGSYLPAPNNMDEFAWLDLLFNFKWLVHRENKLLVKSLQSNDRVLLPLNENLLRATDRAQASHVIIKDNNDIYISNGLSTYKRQSTLLIIIYWLSIVLGLLGLLYVALVGFGRVLTGKKQYQNIIFRPFLHLLVFSIPIYLYTEQSFLNFGELTPASFILAAISGLLPITLLLSLLFSFNHERQRKWLKWDRVALLMLLQLCLVLFYWDVIPIIFWR
jgi:CubicO group peptidase (beta-lactamase class C family)